MYRLGYRRAKNLWRLTLISMVATVGMAGAIGMAGGCARPAPDVPVEDLPKTSPFGLLDARESNAVRFDERWRGEWIVVSGEVLSVEDGVVVLDGYAGVVGLRGLSRDELVEINVWRDFEAACRVGDMVDDVLFLDDCRPVGDS